MAGKCSLAFKRAFKFTSGNYRVSVCLSLTDWGVWEVSGCVPLCVPKWSTYSYDAFFISEP